MEAFAEVDEDVDDAEQVGTEEDDGENDDDDDGGGGNTRGKHESKFPEPDRIPLGIPAMVPPLLSTGYVWPDDSGKASL